MEESSSSEERMIVNQDLSHILGTTIGEPDPQLAQRYLDAISSKDEELLRSLVVDQYPSVLWGGLSVELSDEDRRWSLSVLAKHS